MKALQEMSLVDDFLMNSLTTHEVYGEAAAKYILECILEREIKHLKVVPQKFYGGEMPKDHGVRLDIYLEEEDGEIFDIEPDNNSAQSLIKALPRRVRFYHAKIDAGSLQAGDDYDKLKNVVVIFITTYDPFGRDRVLYTIKNCCVEIPMLPYDDGAKTLFLYTKGKEGNISEELRQLLNYMADSTEENAKTDKLKQLHKMVAAVKRDKEVGLAYMKSFERDKIAREEGRQEGESIGVTKSIISLTCKKIKKGKTSEEIAEELEEDISAIEPIYKAALEEAPEYDTDAIYNKICNYKEN